MIHPDTELRYVNETIGYGIYAVKPIPLGTIVYVKDELDIEVSPAKFSSLHSAIRDTVDKYSYIDERGNRVLSWDTAKYVNHSCNSNSMSTGYGFEIAIRDIPAGEEITDEYGLFNCPEAIPLACGCRGCRGFIYPNDLDTYHQSWDNQVRPALHCLREVEQPLWALVEAGLKEALSAYLDGKAPYRSVYSLKFHMEPAAIAVLN